MSDAATACILLSTYRGSEHLPALLQSLRSQDWPRCQVLARDDGSGDSTLATLRRAAWSSLSVTAGPNVGTKASFRLLLEQAPRADAVFFADQDDVWHLDKVRRAMEALAASPAVRPMLYCSALTLVNAEMKRLGTSPLWPRHPSFENALVENIATGCTIALNRAAAELLRDHPFPDGIIMHDWWAYLVVSAFGEVIYDPKPSISYRIHGENQVGLPTSQASWLLAKILRRFRGGTLQSLVEQGRAFDSLFGSRITSDKRAALDQLLSIQNVPGRIAYLTKPRIYRQFAADNLALAVMIAAGAS